MSTHLKTMAMAGFAVLCLTSAKADVHTADLGTLAPPDTVGGYNMAPFTLDLRNLGDFVTGIPVPAGANVTGSIGFDSSLTHYRVTGDLLSPWSTWSHNYQGDVYHFDQFGSGLNSMEITLPLGTAGFYFYVEPSEFDAFNVTVESAGLTETQSIQGKGGARGFAFWGTGGSTLTSITITSPDTFDGFAIGQFAIDGTGVQTIPDTGVGSGLFALVLFGMGWAARRHEASR